MSLINVEVKEKVYLVHVIFIDIMFILTNLPTAELFILLYNNYILLHASLLHVFFIIICQYFDCICAVTYVFY